MPRRSPVQREHDKATIAELSLKGWSQTRIANYLEVDQAVINRELKRIKAEWKAEALEDTGIYVKAELRRIAMLEAEYWDAWHRSQQEKQTTTQERLSNLLEDSNNTRSKVLVRKEQRTGELAALNGLLKCVELRSKLLGLFPEASAADGQVHLNEGQLSVIATLMGEAHGAGN